MVLLFGERAFCRSVCTFRLWFSWFEKFSFHKLRQTKPCTECNNECTTICPMGLEVAKEIKTLGHIKNQECVKCYNCVKACPNGVIAASFSKTGLEKPGPQVVPPSILHPSILWLQVAMAAIVLVLFCARIGGNMSLSLGFILGFFIIQFIKTKRLSWLSTALLITLPFFYYHSTDLNDLTSTLKGLTLLTVFIILAKTLGVKPERDFGETQAVNAKVPKFVLALIFALAIWLGGTEIFHSAQISRGAAAYGAKDMKLYTEIMEKYGKAHTNPVFLHFSLADAYLSLDNPDKAVEHYEKSLHLSYNLEAAQETLNRLIFARYFPQAQSLAQALEQKYPEDGGHFKVAQGYAQLYLGNSDEAISLIGKGVSQVEVPTSVIQTLAELKLDKNEMDEAQELLEKHVSRGPDRLAPMLAAIYSTKAANNRGITLLEEHLEENWESLYMPLAMLYLQQNKPLKAEELYRKALARNPQDYGAAYYLGLTMAEINRLEEAVKAWQLIPKEFEAYEAAQENIRNAKRAFLRR